MALLDNVVDITVFVGALALLIMSSVILGSADKIKGANEAGTDAEKEQHKVKKNIKNTSMILLIISIVVFVLYGYKLYQSYMGGKDSKGSVTYFF
jgi:1,4-dihydroxy-2-naphthoate octaprenyltransferase